MTSFTFMMLFDESATPMLEAVMASSMSLRFPGCVFQSTRAEDAEYSDMVIPVIYTRCNGGKHDEFTTFPPPDHITTEVQEVFDGLLREARAAQPS